MAYSWPLFLVARRPQLWNCPTGISTNLFGRMVVSCRKHTNNALAYFFISFFVYYYYLCSARVAFRLLDALQWFTSERSMKWIIRLSVELWKKIIIERHSAHLHRSSNLVETSQVSRTTSQSLSMFLATRSACWPYGKMGSSSSKMLQLRYRFFWIFLIWGQMRSVANKSPHIVFNTLITHSRIFFSIFVADNN